MQETFYYKGQRKFNTETGVLEVETIEGFMMNEVVDFTIGKLPEDPQEQLIVRLKNKEDKDVPKEIPIFGKNKEVKAVETKIVRREENSAHIILDQDAIARWRKIFEI